jgi:hypothetical protein
MCCCLNIIFVIVLGWDRLVYDHVLVLALAISEVNLKLGRAVSLASAGFLGSEDAFFAIFLVRKRIARIANQQAVARGRTQIGRVAIDGGIARSARSHQRDALRVGHRNAILIE